MKYNIIIEGTDCVGKSTLSKKLYNYFKSKDYNNVFNIHFPNFEVGESGKLLEEKLKDNSVDISSDRLYLYRLFTKNMFEDWQNNREDLEDYIKIYDRTVISSIIYNLSFLGDKELIDFMSEFISKKMNTFEFFQDKYIIIFLTAPLLWLHQQLQKKKNKDIMETFEKQRETYTRYNNLYYQFKEKNINIEMIDLQYIKNGAPFIKKPHEVYNEVLNLLKDYFVLK